MSDFATAGKEWPRFKCHKVVHALKLKSIVPAAEGRAATPHEDTDGNWWIELFGGYPGLILSSSFVGKHHCLPGGYIVVYDAGTDESYVSYSPQSPFERGYTPLPDPTAS